MALRVLLKKSYSQLAGSFSEGGVASLSDALSGGLHPRLAIPNNNGLHGFTARYLNTSPCPRELVTRSCSRTGVNSVNINHIMKPASVRPATGAGRTFSSKTTTSGEPSVESQIKANGDAFRRKIRITSNAFVAFGVLYCGTLIHKRLD
ncbi:uncharacterized protein LOC119341177 [Triticum dicoccoides]|uniref:uncharacterized protein LOC119341177 n=1 Tax=Triticum dicoccoides TaxID=85692 RepID=UPI0008458A56|nr:uncharacterized protein LOC119341177 [Triticum dicoccoides]XP_044433422.1 uncharacterized protein LOC123159663 [Triticum aestivum]